jgi:hypothetical protein
MGKKYQTIATVLKSKKLSSKEAKSVGLTHITATTKTQGKGSKGQTTIYKTIHRNLKIELHDLLYLYFRQLVDNYSLHICHK